MMRHESEGIPGIIRSARRRWRLRLFLRGLAITLATAFVAFGVSAWLLEALRFSPGAVAGLRVAAWTGVAVVAALFVIRPLFRRVSDRQVALYLEEHEPSFEASLLGAVEAEDRMAAGGAAPGAGGSGAGVAAAKSARAGAASPTLVTRLVERALERARSVEYGRRIEQPGLQRYGGALVALSLAAVALGLWSPDGVRHGLGALLVPTTDAAAVNPYSIAVEPGDATVARGSDLLVRARLGGFESAEVFLWATTQGASAPRRLSMIPAGPTAADGSADSHELLLLNLQENADYFVEADGVRSATFGLEVADLPYVDRMDHTYRFPAYTGLPERVVEDGGDVVGVAGTRVEVVVHPTFPVPAGRLLLEDGEALELVPGPDGALTGELPIDEPGFYRVELAREGDGERWVEASPRYAIDVLRDLRPGVTVTQPGRDAPVSPIEEVYVEARADDDFGVDAMRLVYSVNGGPSDTVEIFRGGESPLREVTAGHTLFLEEWPLEAGDMVSYFVEARDAGGAAAAGGGGNAGDARRWVTSDLYFLEVRPFRRDFREAEQQGGGMPQGGGQAGVETALSELQQQIVVATFNLLRDRPGLPAEEYQENLVSVALAQGRVHDQVRTLLDRMRNRGLAQAEARFREIADLLPGALEAMETSEERLRAGEPGDALRPQQQALRVLQKAEETFERYVGSRQQQPGGGGGGGADAEDLADLFELELDKLQNQYETVQRGERQQQDDTVDEVMERLQELSRRQEQEMERQRQRAGQQNRAGAGGSEGQRELAEETEETARQLERLARETGNAQLQETARRLRDAAESMRRSAAESGGSSGVAEAGSALDDLREAERRLRRTREDRLEEDAEDALRRADRLAESQREVQEQLERLSDDRAERSEQLRRLDERKEAMQREAGELERELDRMAADARRDDPATARELTEAAERIRDTNLEAKIAWSRGVMRERDEEFIRDFEEQIAGDIEAVRSDLEGAARAARDLSGERSAESSLERARDLVRATESLDRSLEAGGGGDSDPRQLRRSFQEQLQAARELRRELEQDGRETGDLDRAVDALESLADAETYGDLPQIPLLQEELRESLKRVEFTLRREVEGASSGRAVLRGADEVPPAFRELVEEYFRSLAREGGSGGSR